MLIFEDNELGLFCPLAIKRNGSALFAKSLGDGFVGYSFAVTKCDGNSAVFESLFNVLKQIKIDTLVLGPLSLSLIEQLNYFSIKRNMRFGEIGVAPKFHTKDISYKSYLEKLPKSAHKDSMRSMRRMAEVGEISFQ